ncbi:MAG: hypothetical protein ACI85I_001331 [Arenicella sp.]|jgi:hypothetical protein
MELAKEVKYQYPEGGSDSPFKAESIQHYFIYGSGFTCLGNFGNFDLSKQSVFKNLLEVIPMGYKALLVCERVLIYENGNKILENTKGISKSKNKKYRIYQKASEDNDVLVETNGFAVLNAYNGKNMHSYEWADIKKAEKKAKEISTKGMITLVCTVVDFVNWH